MSTRNTLENKAIRREQRENNRRKQAKKRLAERVQIAEIQELINKHEK